ncbi:MAG: tetraacyldisaccharide 4'-kinase [Desulfobacter sp.]
MIKSWLSNLEKKIEMVSAGDYTPEPFSFEQALVLVSHIYKAAVKARLWAYKTGIARQKKLPCFVISVGNIMVGGTGKTPVAVCLAEILIEMGLRPVVLSRGYKGSAGRQSLIVGDGRKVLIDQETAGDEPFMMASLKRFPVIIGKDRYAAGRLAMAHLGVDVMILDDGFQHLALARELNLVLFDYDRPLGNGRMLPAGRLREMPGMSGERTHAVIFTRCPEGAGKENLPDIAGRCYMDQPLFYTRHHPVLYRFYARHGTMEVPGHMDRLKGRKAVLFSGIARNETFRETVAGFGVNVLAHLEFTDHYRYKRADFAKIRTKAEELGAELILTTEKDWVKMDMGFDWEKDVGVIGIRVEFTKPDVFKRFLESKIKTGMHE